MKFTRETVVPASFSAFSWAWVAWPPPLLLVRGPTRVDACIQLESLHPRHLSTFLAVQLCTRFKFQIIRTQTRAHFACASSRR